MWNIEASKFLFSLTAAINSFSVKLFILKTQTTETPSKKKKSKLKNSPCANMINLEEIKCKTNIKPLFVININSFVHNFSGL